MKTFVPKKDDIEKKWWVIDAEGKILGRLATEVAVLLRGKNKPQFATFIDTGDFVIVINAEKIAVTGRKLAQKEYYSHSQYPGGLQDRGPGGPPGQEARGGHQAGRLGHDPQEQARPGRLQEAQGLPRPRASARSPESPGIPVLSEEAAALSLIQYYGTGKRKTADRPGLPALRQGRDHPVRQQAARGPSRITSTSSPTS